MLGGKATADELKNTVTVTPQADTTLVDIAARAPILSWLPQRPTPSRSVHQGPAGAMPRRWRLPRARAAADQRSLEGGTPVAAGLTLQSRLEQLNTSSSRWRWREDGPAGHDSEDPIGPSPKRDAILALIAGGLLGLGIALLRARLDDRIRDLSELSERWDLPVLGLIPESSDLANPSPKLPSPAATEAFALARTNLRYLHVGGDVRTVVVTSAIAEEGKSTVSWNLALAAAMAEQRVLLIEADLRRPVMASGLGCSGRRGSPNSSPAWRRRRRWCASFACRCPAATTHAWRSCQLGSSRRARLRSLSALQRQRSFVISAPPTTS